VWHSPYYWAVVGAITLVFAAIDLEALRKRKMSRLHGAAIAVYVLSWVLVFGLLRNGFAALYPAAIRIAVAVVFAGGQLIAELIRGEQRLAHRRHADD